MEAIEKRAFLELLTDAMASYGKPLPEAGMLKAWWSNLEQFPLRVVAMAFAAYKDENGEFAPVPAGIAKRCKLMDGRPTDEEAWAIALTSRNEEDTIVWTEEMAEAFGLCSSILETGDEVGARMAFKDAYNRLVVAARVACKPAKWNVSLGWDVAKREAALERAHIAGLLPAPAVTALLPNYSGVGAIPEQSSPEGLRRVKEAMAGLKDGWAMAAKRREEKLEADRLEAEKRKAEIAEQVAAYENVIPLKAQA